MPRLRKFLFVPFTFAALNAAAYLPMPAALGQTARPFDQRQPGNAGLFQDAGAVELSELRGILEPDQDTGANRVRRGVDGLRDTALPDTQTATSEEIRALSPGAQKRSEQQPRNQNPADGAALDQNTGADPYAALGIRVGSFLLFPELTSETVYSDNVFLSTTNPQSDWALEFVPSLKIQSDWNRHSLTGTLSGIRSYYDRFPTENEETFQADIAGQLDIRRTTTLSGTANYSEFFEDRSSSDFPANATQRAMVRNRGASLEGSQGFNRVTLTLRGEISEEDFEDSVLDDGSIENNDDRDLTERRLTGRAAYEFQPGVSAFVEASANSRVFAERFDDNGTQNGSSGYDLQGGLSFTMSGKLTGEVSAGYAFQKPDEASLKDVDGLIFNAGLEWLATGLTTVRLDASSEINETTQAGSAGSVIRAVEISVEHRPRRHIVLGASLGYEVETFSGSGQEDEDLSFGLSGEYILTRSVALTVGYDYLKSTSSESGSDYDVNEVRMGLRVRR